jgi:arylsulfatase
MFSIMDFLRTFVHIVGSAMPTDRPIDGVDQADVLLGNSATGFRESLLSFIGGDLSPRDGSSGGSTSFIRLTSAAAEPGIFSASVRMAG